jgi:hypothetical protein
VLPLLVEHTLLAAVMLGALGKALIKTFVAALAVQPEALNTVTRKPTLPFVPAV